MEICRILPGQSVRRLLRNPDDAVAGHAVQKDVTDFAVEFSRFFARAAPGHESDGKGEVAGRFLIPDFRENHHAKAERGFLQSGESCGIFCENTGDKGRKSGLRPVDHPLQAAVNVIRIDDLLHRRQRLADSGFLQLRFGAPAAADGGLSEGCEQALLVCDFLIHPCMDGR